VKAQLSLFSCRADYAVEVLDDVVAIVDLALGNRSVTNDAEAVIAELVAQGIIHPHLSGPVVHRDSCGIWDELRVRDGRFAGFLPLNDRDRDTAIAEARSRRNEPIAH
jgi:hypothetical protein